MTDKKCNLNECFNKMSCETKLLYILVIILFVMNIFVFAKLGKCSGTKDGDIAEWVDKNPRAIIDSVQKYAEEEQSKSAREQNEKASANIKSNLDKFRDEKNTGVANAKGKKVIVEFFDYNCGYCKMASKVLEQLAKEDKDIKIIFRDFPIFGGISETAAKYSIAVAMTEPNKFLDFHSALMSGNNARTEEGIIASLKTAGISADKIKKALKAKEKEIEERITENRKLGALINLQGTPALIIGEEFVPGYVDAETIKNMLK